MLKATKLLKDMDGQAEEALKSLLHKVPAIRIDSVESEHRFDNRSIDFLMHISVADERHTLACEVKSNGQPRHVRAALLQLRNYVVHHGKDTVAVLIAPYLSQEAQTLCEENGVGYLDLVGNARLAFDNVYIERLLADRPAAERRELRSLFKPKSAQILRVMLRDPKRVWRVNDLSQAAGVSLGHTSNVRTGLLNHEWGALSEGGFSLVAPDALLDAWRDEYEASWSKRLGFYTTLHGSSFENAARAVFDAGDNGGRAIFASFSAAQWLAPYGRTGTQYFYADRDGVESLKSSLKLSPSLKGENVVIMMPKDDGVFHDSMSPAPGIVCTSAVQTYLDLWNSGERGREAAEHLRQMRLSW